MRAFESTIDDEAYERIALEDGDHLWELWVGVLVEKPGTSFEHNDALTELVRQLIPQLGRDDYWFRFNSARTRHERSFFIPDILVLPIDRMREPPSRAGSLETYAEPASLVVEIWSPSTGRYDISGKLPAYMARGDLEIWRLHPLERRLTVWRRRADGSYAEVAYLGGIVPLEAIPGVTVDLDAVFAWPVRTAD